MKLFGIGVVSASLSLLLVPAARGGEKGEGARTLSFRNPIVVADFPGPDVIRSGDEYYMVASSLHLAPGLPVLKSRDLVHWRYLTRAVASLPSPCYDSPQPGKGIWAPSIRYHEGEYFLFYADPDQGVFVVRSRNPAGPWDAPKLLHSARGWIDPCPFWDDDGRAYLVHAWARSRAGFNSVLTVRRMSPDARSLLGDSVNVFDGSVHQPTIEGPKMYKRAGLYYIFAPAGGVERGWQTVLRGTSPLGPYEDRVVLHQGSTAINGPHQGAWVETASGESWFVHSQERQPFGRIVHLEPMRWEQGWPLIGTRVDSSGCGEPVEGGEVAASSDREGGWTLQASDDFSHETLCSQWAWNANPRSTWWSLKARHGYLRLFGVSDSSANLLSKGNVLLQNLPGPQATITVRICMSRFMEAECGLVLLGRDYVGLAFGSGHGRSYVRRFTCANALKQGTENEVLRSRVDPDSLYLRAEVNAAGVCVLSYSMNGRRFFLLGDPFPVREGVGFGAKIGLFCRPQGGEHHTWADIDWIRIQ